MPKISKIPFALSSLYKMISGHKVYLIIGEVQPFCSFFFGLQIMFCLSVLLTTPVHQQKILSRRWYMFWLSCQRHGVCLYATKLAPLLPVCSCFGMHKSYCVPELHIILPKCCCSMIIIRTFWTLFLFW